MYYIDDYKKRAVEKVIPYLIEFPQIVKILEMNADRYQAIEDVLWSVANNFKLIDSRGVFLDAHAHNEVSEIIYTDKAQDAFTYGTDMPLFQAYGTGHYYSQSSYISGIKKTISEDKLIRTIQAKIIQNNSNGTVEDIIEALKLLYNADYVRVYESNPLNLSIMLIGSNLEISSSGNYENIKQFLPACVSFNNIFVDTSIFDLFMYDESSSYGDSRYPIRVDETVDKYFYISFSVNLDSEFEEYVKTNHNSFEENMFCCITGAFTKIIDNGTLLSSSNADSGESFRIKVSENEGSYYLAVEHNGETQISEYQVNEGDRYTIIVYNTGTELKFWFSNKTLLKGKYSADIAYIENVVVSSDSDITIDGFATFEAPIYLNCLNQGEQNIDFGDFTYYATVFGKYTGDNTDITEYYTSCYGEKQMLFNCLENKNHLYISTNNPLISNIMTRQSYYNYKQSHSAGKYIYMDGKSGIDYFINNESIDCDLSNIDIKFDICMPIEINTGNILSNFVNQDDESSALYFTENGALCMDFNIKKFIMPDDTSGDTTIEEVIERYQVQTGENLIKIGEYANFHINIVGSVINIYKNDLLVYTENILDEGIVFGISKVFKIGYNNDLSSFYKGFLKNVYLHTEGVKDDIEYSNTISLPFKNGLKDETKSIYYINYGARFITVPQLINDTTNLDLYGNELLGIRIYKE